MLFSVNLYTAVRTAVLIRARAAVWTYFALIVVIMKRFHTEKLAILDVCGVAAVRGVAKSVKKERKTKNTRK